MVEHANAFTQANDLAWNPQTLFRCQGARTSVSWLSRLSLSIRGVSIHTLNIPTLSTKERNAPCIPIAEAKGFTARFDKKSREVHFPAFILFNLGPKHRSRVRTLSETGVNAPRPLERVLIPHNVRAHLS